MPPPVKNFEHHYIWYLFIYFEFWSQNVKRRSVSFSEISNWGICIKTDQGMVKSIFQLQPHIYLTLRCVQKHSPTHCMRKGRAGTRFNLEIFVRHHQWGGESHTKRRLVVIMLGDEKGKYHGCKSNFLSEYAPPLRSTSSLYEQDLGHTVSIYGYLFSFLSKEDCGTGNKDKHKIWTCNVNKLTHLPAGKSFKSLFKRLSQKMVQLSFISRINTFQEPAVQVIKYTNNTEEETRRIRLVPCQAWGCKWLDVIKDELVVGNDCMWLRMFVLGIVNWLRMLVWEYSIAWDQLVVGNGCF